jgi:hypothetical protein
MMMNKQKKRSPLFLVLAIIILTLILGWGMEKAFGQNLRPSLETALQHTVDPVPEKYQTGLSLYLDSCSSCHIPIPPQVLPTDTWKRILERPDNHYGNKLPPIVSSFKLLIWDYLRTFSRPLLINEPPVAFIEESRYFKALHPKMEFPTTVTYQTCISCHPQAINFDYRTLNDG